MNTKKKTILGMILFAAFLGLAYLGYFVLSDYYKPNQEIQLEENASQQEEKEAFPAPDFTVYDAQGKEIKLSDFLGKPVVVNFWASWCPPCKEEMPHFNKVYKEVQDDVVFMMIDLVDGQRETKESGQQYVEKQAYDFPVYFDIEQEAAYAYEISSIPTTLFIDAEGNIITGYRGAIDEKTLKAGIDLIKK